MKNFLVLIIFSIFSVSIFASDVTKYSVKLDDVTVSAVATTASGTDDLEELELTFSTSLNAAKVKREIKFSRKVGGDAKLTITDTINGSKNIIEVTWEDKSAAGSAPDFTETALYIYHPKYAYKANQGQQITFTGTDLRDALTILYGYHEAHGKISATVWTNFLNHLKTIIVPAVKTDKTDLSDLS